MENELFYELPLLKNLHGRAWKQLGSSGSGNHFVEFGIVEITEKDAVLGIEAGNYVGLLVAFRFQSIGCKYCQSLYKDRHKQKRRLPGEAKNLAWLTSG